MQIQPINPNDGKALDPITSTPTERIGEFVAKAAEAGKAWAELAYGDKREIFRRIAADFEARCESIAKLMHAEMGKPLSQAKSELLHTTANISQVIDTMEKALQPDLLDFEGGRTTVHYVPLGVAAVITPWNFPFAMPLSLLLPALLAGNTVVFKPSEITTYTGLALAEIMMQHLPADVLQVVVGDGVQGRAMVTSDVDLIAFVGSRAVGKEIMQQASRRTCRIILELGGKDPMIVGKDADLDKAAQFAVVGSLRNSGQVCCAVERIYVEKEACQPFLEKVTEKVQEVSVGDEVENRLCIGPMASKKQLEHVLKQIEAAVGSGATLHAGGKQISRDGYFIEPTVLSGLTPEMAIMREETFGPVVCIQTVDSVDEGIELANNTRYGLAASIWMGNQAEAEKQALRLQAGLVGVNRSFGGAPGTPWAGAKESGFGHTGGVSGMRSFLQPRSITRTT